MTSNIIDPLGHLKKTKKGSGESCVYANKTRTSKGLVIVSDHGLRQKNQRIGFDRHLRKD